MTNWILESIKENRKQALLEIEKFKIFDELNDQGLSPVNSELVQNTFETLELAVLDLVLETVKSTGLDNLLRPAAADAFKLGTTLSHSIDALEAGRLLLRISMLGVLGERGADASRFLKQQAATEVWPKLPFESSDWRERTWAIILNSWLLLIRKNGWDDRDLVLEQIASLRSSQQDFEQRYLESLDQESAKASALELIGLYHLSKAADILAHFMTDGVVEGNHQVQQLLDSHFDRVLAVCKSVKLVELEPLTLLMAACARQMVMNSVWTVTRAVNSRVTKFVESLVDRGRGNKAIFDVLPPQRRTLAEQGLLGSSRRAVVVSLPTSSGKTLIAEFRILQALNQFDAEEGWVAYLAPTRALVNQVTRQLRQDLSGSSLKIKVEKVSPALEVDGVEMGLLSDRSADSKFRVLVTTPEKLDLMLRQGWEEKIGRPLTLVVVDEAHNLQGAGRGLKLELLLSTINKECQNAQFLLLTPFIENAKEVATWLGGPNADDISLGLDWQPNERIVGLVSPVKGESLGGNSYSYSMEFESVHTSRQTLSTSEQPKFEGFQDIAKTFSKANKPGSTAAISAQHLKKRGPVIVMHGRPDWAWNLARELKIEENKRVEKDADIELVKAYIKLELGADFLLNELLDYGIAVHHSGLPEEVRSLVEWLFSREKLDFLIATTTIAQGINFPVSGVVMASHQYFSPKGAQDMPAEDFWNIAGRAGRVSQGQVGVIALAATGEGKKEKLRDFIHRNTGELNSALIQMAKDAGDDLKDLGKIVYKNPEWSTFVQYLTHTYRQMGKPEIFIEQVEQVLRGTFGFEKLRMEERAISQKLLDGIREYSAYLQEPNQPLKLVDSTGFSLQSIKTILVNKGDLNESSWNPETLFNPSSSTLQDMMGVLLRVPELRENLEAVTGGDGQNGDMLAQIVKDWVRGNSLSEISAAYFQTEGMDSVTAMTKCGQNLFGKLTQTTSWGLGALLSITGSEIEDEEFQALSNLPSRVFYGVDNDDAVVLRLLGVPRCAAMQLAKSEEDIFDKPLPAIRAHLYQMENNQWESALGESGSTYRKVWRIVEGFE